MKKTHCAMLLTVGFLLCCGPQLESSQSAYFNYAEQTKVGGAKLLPFEQIRAPDLDMPKKSSSVFKPNIEQWRLNPHFVGEWCQLSPLQTYYFDWLYIRERFQTRYFPW